MGNGGSWGPGEVQGESWGIHIPEVLPKSSHDCPCQLSYRRTDLVLIPLYHKGQTATLSRNHERLGHSSICVGVSVSLLCVVDHELENVCPDNYN